MRTDYEDTLITLRHSLDALRVEKLTGGDFAARFYDTTSLLFERPLCRTAIEAATAARAAPIALQRYQASLISSISASIASAARTLPLLIDSATSPTSTHSDSINAAKQWLENETPFGTAKAPLRRILSELAGDPFPQLTKEKLTAVSSLFMNGDIHVRELAKFAWKTAREGVQRAQYETASQEVQAKLVGEPINLERIHELADAAAFTPIVEKLKAAHSEIVALLDGRLFPLTRQSGVLKLWTGGRQQAIADVERIAALVEARLRSGTAEQHALARLNAYLTHFAKERIAADWAIERTKTLPKKVKAKGPAKAKVKGSKPKRQFETIVQGYVDAFLFAEGLFPITHADASGGKIDTFVDRQQHLFLEVSETLQLPMLLELKAVAWNTGLDMRAEVDSAVTRSLDQGKTYSTHLRARWRAHSVISLVVYDGPTRFKTQRQDVTLIYVGDADPSVPPRVLEKKP